MFLQVIPRTPRRPGLGAVSYLPAPRALNFQVIIEIEFFFPFTSSERTQKTTILTASQGVTNQTKQVITWNKLYFPSHSELINKYNYCCCKEYFNSLMLAGDTNKEACCRCSDSFLLYFYLCLIKLSRLRGQLQLQENNSGLER